MPNAIRILVVDDDENWRNSLTHSLQRYGHIVVTASDRWAAENRLEDGEEYQLVISDNSMPKPNQGIGLCAWMRQGTAQHRVMPFILHTGDETGSAKAAIEELGGIFCEKHDQGALMAFINQLLIVQE